MLEHGGRLRQAARRYGVPLAHWLDLSTGINPLPWNGELPPVASWARLPEVDDGLAEAAREYYGAPLTLPVAGTQAAIQALPRLRRPGRVGVIAPTYAEHGHRWRSAGHSVAYLSVDECVAALPTLDVLIVVNPNNPTGTRFESEQLLGWHAALAAQGGWLIVDEAFIDTTPELSLAAESNRSGLVVLRSFGKFFGLVGARVGFALAAHALLRALAEQLGPWPIATPSRFVAERALRDRDWHAVMRVRLPRASARLAGLLSCHGLAPTGGCALFQWVQTPHAETIYDVLARDGILVRRFDAPSSLRFGLPGTEKDWERLEQALLHVNQAMLPAL
jgi:cobalamin biosynthetic protein CobC